MIEWRPEWAPHVVGAYEPRAVTPEGLPEEQRWKVRCETCGATWQGGCMTGSVRGHISRFAALHLHRDPFATAPPHLKPQR